MNIQKHAHIATDDPNKFFDTLHKVVEEYQNAGLTVDVQYQLSDSIYSAYVTGRCL